MIKWVRGRRATANQVRRKNEFRPGLETREDRLVPATFTVHNAARLAAAITAADSAPGSTINLAPGTATNNYLLTGALPPS
jgi:hypothetical protein